MAVVKVLEKDNAKDYPVSRTTCRCTYTVVHSGDEAFLDLRSYGSDSRMVEGHASQVMQFDRTAARTLYRALRETFDFD